MWEKKVLMFQQVISFTAVIVLVHPQSFLLVLVLDIVQIKQLSSFSQSCERNTASFAAVLLIL